MSILIKYVLRNMKEKKFRLFLIMVSITLSSALFFASNAITDNLTAVYATQMRTFVGNADLVLSKNKDARDQVMRLSDFDAIRGELDYLVGLLFAGGVYTTEDQMDKNLTIAGTSLKDLERYNPIYMTRQLNSAFEGKQLIVSEKFLQENGLAIGDNLKVTMSNGSKQVFRIWGAASPKGLLKDANNQINMIAPRDTVARIYNGQGKVSHVFASLRTNENGVLIDEIESFEAVLADYDVEEALSEDEIRQAIAQISVIFQIMLVLVVFISVYIIFTSFKVMMAERMPVIGTFRSIGATKRSTTMIMLAESLVYGLVGGVIGTGLGVLVLKLMTEQMAYDPWSGVQMEVSLIVSPVYVALTMGTAMILSVVSSFLPIVQASKYPVKDIVLNKVDEQKTISLGKTLFGASLLIVGLAIPMTKIFARSLPINMLCMLGSIIGLVLVLPFVTKLLVIILEKIYRIFGNHGVLAVKNLRENKSIQGNIILLTIGIASLIMINVISYSVSIEVVDVFADGKFEVWSWIGGMDRNDLPKVKTVEGVTDAYGIFQVNNVNLSEKDGDIPFLMGIEPDKYFDYWDYDLIGVDGMEYELNEGRNIILNRSVAEKFNYLIGDQVVLDAAGRQRSYKMIGMTNTLMNNGQVAFISEKYMRNDFGVRYFDEIFVRTNIDPKIANENLQAKFKRRGVWSEPKSKLEQANMESNNQLFIMLQGFSVLTMVIGIFGVFNNYLVSMIHRKRSLAMYRSVGMSRAGMRKMLYIEAVTCGLIGGLAGVAGGLLFLVLVGYTMIAMNLPVSIHMNYPLLAQSIAGGIIVSLLAAISPVIKSSRMSIIQGVKYE